MHLFENNNNYLNPKVEFGVILIPYYRFNCGIF